jgi:2,3,4,5-tetrahydropyridine-2-carboxylate N-succinyltransferase
METTDLPELIEEIFETGKTGPEALKVVESVIERLDAGTITVVEKVSGNNGKPRWQVNAWVKKAVLLYFRMRPIEKMDEGHFFDKVPLKTFPPGMNRIVPYSSVRKGSYVAPKVVIMAPSFINIGAYVDEGAMIDSLVLVGSCARIGTNVHLGAGTVIGGVLEPPNSAPVIVEDGAFVGGNCGIFEGCLVEANAVIAAGTIITGRTPIIDVHTGEEYFGRVPENAVVVPGGRPKKINGRDFTLQTPLIIKRRDPSVDAKLAMEDSLRIFD